jgi:hypothetical protein
MLDLVEGRAVRRRLVELSALFALGGELEVARQHVGRDVRKNLKRRHVGVRRPPKPLGKAL